MTTDGWTGLAVRLGDVRTLDALGAHDTIVEAPAVGEVVVQVGAAAVNRSDVLNALGLFPHVPSGRVPGRDFAGTVVAGPSELVGTEVWGTGGGDLGLTRDGSHARYLKLPAEAVVERPSQLAVVEAGAAGLAFFVAASALKSAEPLMPGMNVLVTGAGGGVGGAVIGLAKASGARTIGVVRGADNASAAIAQGADVVIDIAAEDLEEGIRSATVDRGLSLIVDSVGPPLVNQTLPMLETGGQLRLLTAPQGGTLEIDVLDFYRRALTFAGINTLRSEVVAIAGILRGVVPAIRDGYLKAPRVSKTIPISQAGEAYATVHAGGHQGRVVLIP